MMRGTPPRAARRAAAALAAAVLLTLPLAPEALAQQPSSRITAIFETDRCASQPCEPGRDQPLGSNARVAGPIQIHVEAQAQLGLEWVRLEAHVEGRPAQEWICLQYWVIPAASQFQFRGHLDWDTRLWPDAWTPESNCEDDTFHFHHQECANQLCVPPNGRINLRVIARQRPPDRARNDDWAPVTSVRFVNAPVQPRWADDPEVSGSSDSAPSVRLRWAPNPEETTMPAERLDIVEYHFVRVGPDGTAEFAVNAANPGGQGCQKISAFYQCTDRRFAAAFAGEYRYAVIAFRPGHGRGAPCATAPGRCLESPLSAVRTVTLTGGPPVGPAATETGDAEGDDLDEGDDTGLEDDIEVTLPLPVESDADRAGQIAAAEAGEAQEGGGTATRAAAAVLVLAIAAVHLRRILRARGATR